MSEVSTLEELDKITICGTSIADMLVDDSAEINQDNLEQLFVNISNTKGVVIYDLGPFWHDPDVKITIYENGVDLARFMGSILFKCPYNSMSYRATLEGYDYMRIHSGRLKDFSVADLILYFLRLIKGSVYINKADLHVHVRGEIPTEETWKAAVDEYSARYA